MKKKRVTCVRETNCAFASMRLLLLTSVSFIFAIGLMMVFNTSSAEILDRSLNQSHNIALYRQIAYALIGILVSSLIWKVGYDHLLKLSLPLLIGSVVLLIFVFIPGIGVTRNGAHRWLGIGNFTFQPSEFVKYLIPMVYIDTILNVKEKPVKFFTFAKIAALLFVPIFMVMVEPDNGTAAVMGATLLPLFFVSEIRFKYWALPVLVMIAVMGTLAINLPYVKGRLEVYMHPELDLKGKGHQPHQAKIAAGSGKFLGRGAGGSLQKFTYLPEAQNDYIAAIYAEEFGFLGMLILLMLYMLFAFGGFAIALHAKTPAATFLAMTITFLIASQAFLNLGVASAMLPSKGVNLPFFSQGGTSLIANFIGLTLLLDIAKRDEKQNFA